MTIDQLVQMARRIHDTERWHLGASSTRDTRNAFWARVIGCAHHGHAIYNPTPDAQWHLKKADAMRPQTDDVATSMPSRDHWDCIPGAGADGYYFAAAAHGPLPAGQIVYPPPVPDGVKPAPAPPSVTYPGDATFDALGVALWSDYALAQQAPNPLMARWFGRVIFDHVHGGLSMDASIAKHRQTWRSVLNLPKE